MSSNNTFNTFDTLDVHSINRILGFLDYESLRSLRSCNRMLHGIINSDLHRWVEMQTNGLILNSRLVGSYEFALYFPSVQCTMKLSYRTRNDIECLFIAYTESEREIKKANPYLYLLDYNNLLSHTFPCFDVVIKCDKKGVPFLRVYFEGIRCISHPLLYVKRKMVAYHIEYNKCEPL